MTIFSYKRTSAIKQTHKYELENRTTYLVEQKKGKQLTSTDDMKKE